MRMSLYTTVFDHNGTKTMSINLMVWRSDFDCSAIDVPGYVESAEAIFEAAMDTVGLHMSIKAMLEAMGNEVDVDPVLLRANDLADHLRREYAR